MEISNSLASTSMVMAKSQTSQSVNMATLKLAMDVESANADALAELLQSAAPSGSIDMLV